MIDRSPLQSTLGPMLGIGIFGAFLSALAVWILDGPLWAMLAGYVIGGMVYTVLGAFWLPRSQQQASD